MENIENIQSKKIKEYYKANIDVHIDYLLALNNFKSISSIGFMELAPILESVRNELYKKIDGYQHCPIYGDAINKLLIIELSLILTIKGADDVLEYIAYNLTQRDLILLSTACMLNSTLKSIPEIKCSSELNITIASLLENLKKRIPASNLTINGVSEAVTQDFLEKLRIHPSTKDTLLKYIYETISILKCITTLLVHNGCDVNHESIEKVYRDFSENLVIRDFQSLTKALDEITESIQKLNEKNIEKRL